MLPVANHYQYNCRCIVNRQGPDQCQQGPQADMVNQGIQDCHPVINPDDVVASYGADSLRLYEMFMGPLEATKPWTEQGVKGVFNFLGKAWKFFGDKDHIIPGEEKAARQFARQIILMDEPGAIDGILAKESNDNIEDIKSAIEKLSQTAHKLAEEVYKEQQAQQGGPQQAGGPGGPQQGPPPGGEQGTDASGKPDDDVVDAEFEEVDDEKKGE